MRVFKSVDDRHLNSESLYKTTRLGHHLDQFKLQSGANFSSFIDLSKTPAFKNFLTEYLPLQKIRPLAFTRFDEMDAHFRDYDLLMVYVFDGGKLENILSADYINSDVPGLIQHLFSTSPQTFIIKSGLKPGYFTNHMYLSLVRDLIECYPDQITNVLNSAGQSERDRMYINIVNLAHASGIGHHHNIVVRNAPNNQSIGRLTGLSNDSSSSTLYLCELRSQCRLEPSPKELGQLLACTFMTEAFRLSLDHLQHDYLAGELRRRALAWAVQVKCPMNQVTHFVDQLVAISLCTSPHLFKRSGFSRTNLTGLNVNLETTGIVKTISDGPFSAFIKPDYDMDQTLNCLEFLHEIDKDFSLNDIYENSGFRHTNAIKILAAIGGHCPGAEYAIVDTTVEPENVFAVLRVVSTLDCYDKFSEEALVKLMSYYVDRMPLRGKDGQMIPTNCLELTSDVREHARLEFKRAYEVHPFFKERFIQKLETLEGLTIEHLRVFSLTGHELRKTMTNISRKDRGQMLEDDLGL